MAEGGERHSSPILSPSMRGLTSKQLMEITDDLDVFTEFYSLLQQESQGITSTPFSTPCLPRKCRSFRTTAGLAISPVEYLISNEEKEDSKLKRYFQVNLIKNFSYLCIFVQKINIYFLRKPYFFFFF